MNILASIHSSISSLAQRVRAWPRRRKWWSAVAAVIAGIWIGTGIPPVGWRYHYLLTTTDLTIDGEAVRVTGLQECARDVFPDFGGARRGAHQWSNTSYGRQLKSGGAVIVATPNACEFSASYRAMFSQHYYPAIYVLDDAVKPTRIEYHFSDVALKDPASRVQLVGFEAEVARWSPIRSYDLLLRYQWWLTKWITWQVPWVERGEPIGFLGYAVKADELSKFDQGIQQLFGPFLKQNDVLHLSAPEVFGSDVPRHWRVDSEISQWNPGSRCQPNSLPTKFCAESRDIRSANFDGNSVNYDGLAATSPFIEMRPLIRNSQNKYQFVTEHKIVIYGSSFEKQALRGFYFVPNTRELIDFTSYSVGARGDLSPVFPPVFWRIRGLICGLMRPVFPVPFSWRTRWA